MGHSDDPTDQIVAIRQGDVEPFGNAVLVGSVAEDGVEHLGLLVLDPLHDVLLEKLIEEDPLYPGGVARVGSRVHGSPCLGPGISFAGSVPGPGPVACLRLLAS